MGAEWTSLPKTDQTDNLMYVVTFDGGHNVGMPASMIGKNQSSDEAGWGFDGFPGLKNRVGSVAYGSSPALTPHLLANFKHNKILRIIGTKLQYDNAGTWTDIGTITEADADYTNFEVNGKEAVIIVNGTDVKFYDGTSYSNLSANAPKGKYITNDTVRVWIAKDSTLSFCGFLQATDWTSAKNSGSVEFYTPNGGNITALTHFDGRVIVFKEDAMGEIHGTNYFEFDLVTLTGDVGCINHKTIASVKTLLFWMDRKDVYVYDGGMPRAIGLMIRGYLDRINWPQVSKCFGGTDGQRYYLGLVLDTATEPNIVLAYDPAKQQWHVDTINDNYRYSLLFNNVWYMMDKNGQAFKRTGSTDKGAALSAYYVTKPEDHGMPQAEKEYMEMHVQGDIPVGSTLNVSVSTLERGTSFQDIDTISGSSQPIAENLIIPLDTINICKWVRFKFTLTGPGTLYQAEVYYNLLPVQH